MDDKMQRLNKKNEDNEEDKVVTERQEPNPPVATRGWGFLTFSFLSNLQKAVDVATEKISCNATAVAETASKSFVKLQDGAEDSEPEKDATGESPTEKKSDDEDDKLRKSTLDKLEKGSEDSLLSQSLKAFDNSIETFALWSMDCFRKRMEREH